MQRRITTSANYAHEESRNFETVKDRVSETVPGQAYTIQQLLQRHLAGQPLSGHPTYYDSDEFEVGFYDDDPRLSPETDLTDVPVRPLPTSQTTDSASETVQKQSNSVSESETVEPSRMVNPESATQGAEE